LHKKLGVAPVVMLYHDRIFGYDAGLNLSYRKLVDVSYILRVKQLRSIVTAGVNISNKFYIGLAVDGSLLLSDVNTDLNLRFRF